jgi:glutamate 5-kinase
LPDWTHRGAEGERGFTPNQALGWEDVGTRASDLARIRFGSRKLHLDREAGVCYLAEMRRELLKGVSRVVVKLGTGVLTDSRKQPDVAQMEQLVAQVAAQRQAGQEIAIVSSGAVGAGMGALGYARRPTEVAELQACAAVGQSRLMALYEKLFARFDLQVAQVLLTHDDLQHHDRHLNARNTLITLLQRENVVPIINENDAVSVTELKFGDNDQLSALVASLLPADLLVILTTVEGVMEDYGKPGARILPVIENINQTVELLAGGTESVTAVGGMASKIQAAKIVTRSGIPLVIASGRKKGVLAQILAGKEAGTIFVPRRDKLKGRKRWIAFFHRPKGSIFVDAGARKALRDGGKSLLPPGITRCEGEFGAGDIVRICDLDGTEFARGISDFDSARIQTRQLPRTEVVHRDNLVVL